MSVMPLGYCVSLVCLPLTFRTRNISGNTLKMKFMQRGAEAAKRTALQNEKEEQMRASHWSNIGSSEGDSYGVISK